MKNQKPDLRGVSINGEPGVIFICPQCQEPQQFLNADYPRGSTFTCICNYELIINFSFEESQAKAVDDLADALREGLKGIKNLKVNL